MPDIFSYKFKYTKASGMYRENYKKKIISTSWELYSPAPMPFMTELGNIIVPCCFSYSAQLITLWFSDYWHHTPYYMILITHDYHKAMATLLAYIVQNPFPQALIDWITYWLFYLCIYLRITIQLQIIF